MKWILLLIVTYSGTSVHTNTIEFDSKEACFHAQAHMPPVRHSELISVCVEKGNVPLNVIFGVEEEK